MVRKTNKCIAAAVAGVLFALPLVACGSDDPSWKMSHNSDFVSVHTSEQASYISSSNYDSISADGTKELSRPKPLRLTFSYGDCKDYTVEVSRDEDFTDSVSYYTTKGYVDVYNLYVGEAYAWRVTAELNGKTVTSDVEYFITDDKAPRNIYVDGVTNVRDLGGWQATVGRVKQSMIYRCGRLNKSWQSNVEIEITDGGVSTMLNELGIKSEIDLRRPEGQVPENRPPETGGITESPLGASVNYYNVPMNMDVANPNKIEGNAEAIKEFFAILGNKDNYPMIFHCDIGTDRTGMCAFLINGLLGVSESNLYRDYMFSNFGKIGSRRSLSNITGAYVDVLKKYGDGTLAQKIRNYLVNEIGVSETDIDTMCEMMTETE